MSAQLATLEELPRDYRDALPSFGFLIPRGTFLQTIYLPDKPYRRCWHYFVVNAEMQSNLLTLNGADEFLVNSQLRSPDQKPDDNEIVRRLQQSFGAPLEASVIGHWKWTPGQALVADHFGRGRVWLAGDAIHLFTPTGGFGLNAEARSGSRSGLHW